MKKRSSLLALGLSILMTAAAAKGQNDAVSSDAAPNAAVVVFAPQDQGPAEQAEGDLTFTYDPSILDTNDAGIANVGGVTIPVSINDPELLKNARVLSRPEFDTFMKKKSAFLVRTAKTLRAIRIPVPAVSKLLDLMNKAFFRDAAVVAEANAKVTTINIGVALGAGLPDWLMKMIRRSPLLSDVPERMGFYFMLSTGFSIVHTMKNGRLKIAIEPIVEFRRATRIFSPFVFGAAGFTGAFTFENRERDTMAVQKIGFYRLSSLNIFSSENHFGFSAAAAAAFPPGGGAVAGMEGEVYRFRVTPSNFKTLLGSFLATVRATLRAHTLTCERAFSS